MAAELTYDQNGVAQIFSVRETPWHREGHVLTDAPTFDAAFQMAGHDFEVVVKPTYRQIVVGHTAAGEPITDFVENGQAKITMRTDTSAELGAVGNWYTPLQNRDAFAPLVPLVESGIAHLETGGTLRAGADVWMQARFDLDRFGPVVREVFADEVVPFATIANNHSGRRGVLLQLTPQRIVCANTLGMAEAMSGLAQDNDDATASDGRAMIVRHTASVGSRVVEAAEQLFKGIVERYEVVATQYRALKARTLATEEFNRLVLDVIAPDPRDNARFNPEARMAEATVERAEKKRAELTRLWTEGDGHTGDHSAWEAYNAATQALDHNGELWPCRSGVLRTQSLMFGEYGKMKQRVLNKLVAAAAD